MYTWRSVASGWRENEIGKRPLRPRVTTALIGSICGHGCEWSRTWPDQIADLIVGKSSDTINRGG